MQTSDRQNQQLKIAARGALVGIVVYLIISSLKLGAAYFFHSASLRADGLNNLTDIISSILIFIGLRIARKPADEDHYFGHSKFEPLASFATSLIMFTVGLEVIKSSAERFIAQDYPTPDLQALWVGLAASVILLVTQRYIHYLAQQTQSMGLKASAKDLFSDFLTTLATMVAIAASSLGLAWLDILTALIIGAIILHTAYT
ncbi:MAG: cation transporter, partial [Abiotrophia defectiva]|nr:cation transporter [Abiotrophia defectiva]